MTLTGHHFPTSTTAAMSRAVASLDADTLRELAAIAETRRPQHRNAWHRLPVEAVDEALRMLAAGAVPALGWWRDHMTRVPATPAWPTMPPKQAPRPWQAWELVAAAVNMTEEHLDTDLGRDVLASLAARHHCDARALADAYIALEPAR